MTLWKRIFNRYKQINLFVREAVNFYMRQVKFNASSKTEADLLKTQYTLLRLNHTIEKGMSLPEPRVNFGREKAMGIIAKLENYIEVYGKQDSAFLEYPLNTLHGYVEFSKSIGSDVAEVELSLKNLQTNYENLTGKPFEVKTHGIEVLPRQKIQAKAASSFEELLYSRHSVRSFEPEEVDRALIDKALELAQRTPSACNRQGWKTHVFNGEAAHKLLLWQEGSCGFEDQIHTAILVTAEQRAFLDHEVYQAYVDGGLYAMNLINALHSLGLGTIPVSCGFKYSKLRKLYSLFDIPESEVPIVIVCCGYMPEDVKVAVSERKPVERTNTYH